MIFNKFINLFHLVMGTFEEGNDFWKLRLRHGSFPKFEDPNQFLDKAVAYFEHLEQNHFNELDFRGKDAVKVVLPKMRIATKADFALYCGFSEWKSIESYKTKSNDFAQVITRVENAIETCQLQAAAAGFVKENIVSRLLGLADKKEMLVPGEKPSWLTQSLKDDTIEDEP
jgi:hypothetical protein